ncbi:WXG100 family type VII secretion target [Saccharopolyspora rosea]|uniref:WXG100 family type VII secretion target n=1 Tax=Saccharopolyspora rosea TaxID=524884 RepID=UPI0037C754AD
MGHSINTVVEADPGSCREAARWLAAVCAGMHDLGTGLHRAKSESESMWEGDAGDAFRDLVSDNAGDADQVAEFLNRAKIALENFANSIATVTTRIDQARMVARQGGLVVTETTIEEPPKPDIPLYNPGPGARRENRERSPEDKRILADYGAKCDVWNEVKVTVDDARADENAAHETLIAAISMNKDLGSYLVPKGWAWAPMLTGAYSGPHTTAKALADVASTAQARAEGALAVLDDPTLTPADRQKVLSNQIMWAGKVRTAETAAQSAKNLDAKIPGSAIGKQLAGKSIRGVGIVGGIVTVYNVKKEIDSGVPKEKAVTKGVATSATGAAVGIFMTAAASAGYISGVVASGGTLLLGTVAAAGVGYYIDHHYYH